MMIMNSTVLKPAKRERHGKGHSRAHRGFITKGDNKSETPRESETRSKFWDRLHSVLKALAKIEENLTPEQWRKFIRAYSQHWIASVERREIASAPKDFFAEWAQIQELGEIPMDTHVESLYGARHYRQYDPPRDLSAPAIYSGKKAKAKSPRERARKTLGLDDAVDDESPREAARRVLGIDEANDERSAA